jgi:hypothetical protein
MKSVKLQKLLEDFSLNKKVIAEQLFPHNKHPVLSFNRILSGRGALDSDQLAKLAAYVDVSLESLYSGDWSTEDNDFIIEINCDDFIGLLRMGERKLSIFDKKSLHFSVYSSDNDLINAQIFINQIAETIAGFK